MKVYAHFLFWACVFSASAQAQGVWSAISSPEGKNAAVKNITNYKLYKLDEQAMKAGLSLTAGAEKASATIDMPMPDGTLKTFRVWPNELLPAPLAAKYPSIKTYTAEAIGEPGVTAKIDFTSYGFHAMVFNGENTTLIDPLENGTRGNYVVRYKRDETRPAVEKMHCSAIGKAELPVAQKSTAGAAQKTMNGYKLRIYRLALACNHQYAQKVTNLTTPGKDQVLAKMVTTMNRVNGVYERELSVTMTLVPNEDTLIFPVDFGDPFSLFNDDANSQLQINQKYCDSLIGNANYDLGHVFSTGGGGLSSVAVVCTPGSKAQSATGSKSPSGDGFDVDYVAHEMGHEFGADHTFNNNLDGSCKDQAVSDAAFEPGSGSTIMAYAGICSPDDLQPHSDAYFCATSLKQFYRFITTVGDGCAVKTATNNKPASLPAFTSQYYIPYLTPFELEAPAAHDSVTSSTLTYCWEQNDLGDFGKSLKNTSVYGPLFRSFTPDTARLRVFPKMNKVFGAILDDSGNENNEGEKVPDAARILTFRPTVRNIFNGNGCFYYPDDSIRLDAVNTGKGFTVTSQGKLNILYLGASEQTVTWDVVHTTDAPISAAYVDITMTDDSGKTWPYFLGHFPNNGSAIVTLPNPASSNKCRIKVKGSGNVFFNVNRYDFSLAHNPDSTGEVSIFPVPAASTLNIVTGRIGTVQGVIFDVAGRRIWEGEVAGITSIDVTYWPRAIYFVKLIDVRDHVTVRKVLVH